ncbi:hypothetical protein L1887_35691 [Cichorium endivia]|nr:hypothetical protein L1887_35691 [Cichorium endivia]
MLSSDLRGIPLGKRVRFQRVGFRLEPCQGIRRWSSLPAMGITAERMQRSADGADIGFDLMTNGIVECRLGLSLW